MFRLPPYSFLLLFFTSIKVRAEISSSSDLNCDFKSTCRWRNSTDGGGHFETTTLLEADAQNRIMPLDENDPSPFAYTAGLMGRTLALLVSEVITCQLGGASIKYWYYKTGLSSSLEVCIRQPPGNRDINAMRCYDGVSSTFGKQWIFRAVELPPIAQPFEIVFKTIYSPPNDVIALDNIVFESTLCGYGRDRRDVRRIGYHDWQSYRKSNVYSGELMLIVAQDVADNLTSTTPSPTTVQLEAKINILGSSSTSSSTTTTTTTTEIPTTSQGEIETTTSTVPSTTTTVSSSNIPTNTTLSNEQQFANFVNFLKQTAPVIPYIPTLVRSLTSLDPRVPAQPIPAEPVDTSVGLRRAPVVSSHFYNTNQPTLVSSPPPLTAENQETLVELAKKFGLLEKGAELTTVAIPTLSPNSNIDGSELLFSSSRSNSFGLPNKMDSVYPQELIKQKRKIPMNPAVKIDDIEKVHRQIFKIPSTTTPSVPAPTDLIIFKQPTNGESEVAEKLADIAKYLPAGEINDLTSLRNIPDLEGLTKGMDLTDIRRPGGFSRLKKQFMERLMRRTLGLPIENDDVKVLPPAIVPMKVTRRMMAEMMKATHRRKKLSRRI